MLKKIIVMTENQNLTVIDSEVICNQQVNVYGTRENPLFLAKDVANWLGHSNPSRMLSKIDEDEKITIFANLELQKGF
jgi:prophage antirepressor-like protein